MGVIESNCLRPSVRPERLSPRAQRGISWS